MRAWKAASGALLATAVTMGASASTAMASVPSAAAATTRCTGYDHNERTISLPNKPDIWMRIMLCVERVSSTQHYAYAKVYWDASFIGGNRFDGFKLHVRLERNDSVKDTWTCNLKSVLNDWDSGPTNGHFCGSAFSSASQAGGWTADGKADYDVDNDGKGYLPSWQLQGSPSVS
ncbi:hypothetical protein [Streptomyces tailanensis]|uniref:hypothetical protein n=1 Tax=Streptomyces tailanensis TaxID=2569858 RepID=UPI00122E3B7C|nr:hypothetical protein [Streptomyces tailanensis]